MEKKLNSKLLETFEARRHVTAFANQTRRQDKPKLVIVTQSIYLRVPGEVVEVCCQREPCSVVELRAFSITNYTKSIIITQARPVRDSVFLQSHEWTWF